MDGNKRWAKKENLPVIDAYKVGIDNVLNIANILIEKDIKYFSVFTLSTENLKRNSVNKIFNSIFDRFSDFLEKIIEEKSINIKIIGEKNDLPSKLNSLIIEAEQKTKNYNKLNLILAFNYGFRSEIISVLKKGFENINNKKENLDNLNIKNLFYLGDIPDPDILIRTGGYQRLSNYIMYNLCYTELFFTETLWPEFNNKDLEAVFKEFENIQRNYGL